MPLASSVIHPLSLHDALPISQIAPRRCTTYLVERSGSVQWSQAKGSPPPDVWSEDDGCAVVRRSEEHTSELQSRGHLVCRLLLEKKKKYDYINKQYIHDSSNR